MSFTFSRHASSLTTLSAPATRTSRADSATTLTCSLWSPQSTSKPSLNSFGNEFSSKQRFGGLYKQKNDFLLGLFGRFRFEFVNSKEKKFKSNFVLKKKKFKDFLFGFIFCLIILNFELCKKKKKIFYSKINFYLKKKKNLEKLKFFCFSLTLFCFCK